MLIDTHCHLNFHAFKDDAATVAMEALDKNIWMINVGSQLTTSRRALEFAQNFPCGVYAAVGLHPYHLCETEVAEEGESFETRAEEFSREVYLELARDAKVVAIGETGLDYHYAPDHLDIDEVREKQRRVFMQQLDLADEMNKPVIIHARDTYVEIHEILKSYLAAGKLKRRGVVHCFSGTYDQAKDFLEHGFLISLTGIITFEPRKSQLVSHANLMEVLQNAPLDRLMIETDAPYLTPAPHRGERNVPSYVEEVARKIAEVRKLSFEEVAERTTRTAKEFFQI
jgi:TatD DNase family protein